MASRFLKGENGEGAAFEVMSDKEKKNAQDGHPGKGAAGLGSYAEGAQAMARTTAPWTGGGWRRLKVGGGSLGRGDQKVSTRVSGNLIRE